MSRISTMHADGRVNIHVSRGNRPDLYWSPAWETHTCDNRECEAFYKEAAAGFCPVCGIRTRLNQAGGYNSYVIVEHSRVVGFQQAFKLPDGTLVDLLSINGGGEVRWSCRPRDLIYARERARAQKESLHQKMGDFVETSLAATYFGLEPA